MKNKLNHKPSLSDRTSLRILFTVIFVIASAFLIGCRNNDSTSNSQEAGTGQTSSTASPVSGTALWARIVSGGSGASRFNAVTTDSVGNAYAVGYQGAGTFTYGTQNVTGGYGGNNAVIIQYDSTGTPQWAQTATVAANESTFNAVAADSAGNIYAAGYQTGNSAFTYGTQNATGTYSGGNNALLVKFNNNGTVIWARTVSSGSNASTFNAVTTDSAGNIYAAGYQTGNSTYTYGTQNAAGVSSSNNIILVKYDVSGAALWARTVSGGLGLSMINAVATDNAGNIYAAGYQTGNSTYTYGSQSITGTFNSGSAFNVLLLKYDNSGSVLWARTVSAGPNYSYFNAVTTDSGGNVYAIGNQVGGGFTYGTQTPIAPAGYQTGVVVKYDSAGNAISAQTQSAATNSSAFNSGTTDSMGNIYVAGYQTGNGTFTYGTQSATGTYNGQNIIVVKYDSTGSAQWAKTVSAGLSYSQINGVASNANGNIFTVGFQFGTTSFIYGSQSVTGPSSTYNAMLVKYQ
ncbi:MAG: hypothetical protein JSR44_16090 [Spirochaetes bacterium]|nr:hypothetical protein [Spirochaetota bacterium]